MKFNSILIKEDVYFIPNYVKITAFSRREFSSEKREEIELKFIFRKSNLAS